MKPFYLPVEDGFRFFVYHPAPDGRVDAAVVVYVPPFAEEMNKCRHMAAAAARRMVAAGFAVLVPDFAGCGDSSGDFGDADWETWRRDVDRAVDWAERAGHSRVILWGVRLGAMLAAQVSAGQPGRIQRCLLWQPVASGESALTQFLRMRIAAGIFSAKSAVTSLAQMRADLAAGHAVEVAGYTVTPRLANSLAGLKLAALAPTCPVDWLEVAGDASRGLSPASAQVIERWRGQGTTVAAAVVSGEQFWTAGSNEDVVDCDPLLEATEAIAKSW